MPGILAHYLCGDRVINLIENENIAKQLNANRQFYNIGTQGPDILFYHGAWPWKKSLGINKIGEKMHEEGSGEFFRFALEYINKSEVKEKDELAAYLCGFACHYSLDLHTHPYIFYKTGFVRSGEAHTNKYAAYHRMFETAIDVLMLERQMQLKPYHANAAALIKLSQADAVKVGKMYEAVLQHSLGIELRQKQVAASIIDMSGITKALRDKSGRRKSFISGLESRMGKQPMISGMVHPPTVTVPLDYLNLEHSEWSLPWDNTAVFTYSFPEMFESAAKEACHMIEAIYDSLYSSNELEPTLKLLGNRSFSSGMNCDEKHEFLYFDCIYE